MKILGQFCTSVAFGPSFIQGYKGSNGTPNDEHRSIPVRLEADLLGCSGCALHTPGSIVVASTAIGWSR